METVALLYEDYQKELAKDFKNTFLKRASDTDSSRSNDTVIDEVTDMLSTNIAVYTEKLLQRWGFSSGGEGGSGGGDVTVTLDDLLQKYLEDNYVTIKGDQEVYGEKDFRKGIRIAGRRLYWDEGNDALVIEGAAYTTRWLSAKGVSPGGGGAGSGGAAAMYQLIDVSPNDTKDAVLGAEKDYVLTFDGNFWRGMPNKGGLSSKLFTALDKDGNEVNPDDENSEIYAIRANYSLWSVGFLSAKGISDGGTGGGGGGAVALYQLLDVEKNADITGVAGATKGSVLTFNGDKWYADKPKTAAGISNLFTALDKDGNEVDLNDESKLGTITNIRANYSLWSVGFLSAKGISDGGAGGGGGGAVALYQLLDVEKNSDITGVAGATKGSVLTFNGDKWYADKPKTAEGINRLFSALDADGNEVDLNDESKLGTITNIRANYALWSVDWISAKGKSSGGSGGGGGLINLVYGFESLGGTFDNNDNSATFNAFTINEIWKLASSGLTNVTVTGSGNAVTDVTKGSDGRSLTFTKGSTFATKSEFDALNTKFNDFLTGSDADDIINKWSELEVFLQGMKESDNLAVILQSKMDKTAFSKLFTALDASGNEVDPSDDTKTIASIRANFGFWGVDYISAKGVSKGSGGTGGASTLYQLVDVLANDTEDGVEGAAAGKALVFDGTHWRAGDAGLNESQLYSYLTANKYLTQSAADSRYVTSSRKVIAGTGLSGGGALTSDVTLSLGTSGVVAGTYTKVIVDAYGRVTSGTNLSATDIPNLDWSKITTGKPTTLAGYGITDAYTKTEADGKYVTIATAQTVSGAKTFSATMKTASVLPSTDANSALGGIANRWGNVYSVNGVFSQNVTAKLLSASETLQIGDAYLKWDSTNNAVYVIKKDGTTPVGFYSTDWLSAKGVSMSGAQTGTLDSLNDVEITNPTNGQALKYDAISQKWVNGTIDSFNVNQMWAELKKADSSKVIDASHIPTSVLDNRWVKKAGDTMTGTLTSASTTGSIIFKGLENCDITNFYTMNGTLDSATNLAIRNGLRFNWYDTYWYIGNLRGAGTNSSGFGIANESNKLCLQVTPNNTIAPVFRSTVATGVSPLIVNSTTVVENLNSYFLEGRRADSFTSIVGRRSIYTSGTAPYNYIYLFRIANSSGYSTLRVDIDIKTRYHRAVLFVDIKSDQYPYGNNGTSVYISKFQVNGQSARLWYKMTKQSSGYNYIDFYYESGAWNSGSYDVILRGSNGTLVFEPKNTNIDNIPSGCTEVIKTSLDGDISGNAATATALKNSRTLWGQPFNGTANVSGNMTGVGSINMSGQLTSTVASGVAPFIVSSNTVVGNLNADLLDGVHLAGLSGREGVMRSWLRGRYTTVNQYFGNGNVVTIDPKPTDDATLSVNTTVLSLGDVPTRNTQLAFHYDTNTIKYRRHDDSKWNDWVVLIHSGNYASYSDGRYVKKTGDTMTGNLAMDTNKGFYIPHGTRVVKTSGHWIHGGSDRASSTDANLRFASWYGMGWYPTIDTAGGVKQGNNAMWLNVRYGNLNVAGGIKESTICIGRVNSSGEYDVAYNGEINRYDHHLFLQHHSGKYLIMCTGGGLAGIGTGSPGEKLHVAGNTRTDGYFRSTVGTGTQPYQCNSTTLNSNLNADMLDNWHLNFLPRNYNIGRCYAVRFALGGEDNGWKKIFACSESGTSPYRSVTVWGRIWYAHGNHAQTEVWNYHFCAIFYMRSGPSSSNSSVGNVENSARLYLPTFAKGMDNIRLVRVGTNNFELQVRQISSYHNANIEYQYWSYGCNVSAWESLQSTSNTTVAVSAGGASTLADSRASSADVWTSARTFYIQDHNASHTGAGVSVNGSANVYLKLPDSIQCSGWFRSTGNTGWYHENYGGGWYMTDANYIRNFNSKRLRIQTDTYDTIQLVRTSGSGGSSIAFYNGGGTFRGQLGVNASSWFSFNTGTATANQNVVEISPAGGIHSKAEITAKASGSDIRLKKDIQNYNAMNIINRFRSVKYHWNDIAKANSEVYNNDYDQFGLIAQDLIAGGFGQWVRDVFHDYYTVTYERLIPVVWKGLQEVDDEVTKLKKEVARLNKRVKELEKSLCA